MQVASSIGELEVIGSLQVTEISETSSKGVLLVHPNPRYQASLEDIVNHDWLKHEDISPFAHRRMSIVTELVADSMVHLPQEGQSPETGPQDSHLMETDQAQNVL